MAQAKLIVCSRHAQTIGEILRDALAKISLGTAMLLPFLLPVAPSVAIFGSWAVGLGGLAVAISLKRFRVAALRASLVLIAGILISVWMISLSVGNRVEVGVSSPSETNYRFAEWLIVLAAPLAVTTFVLIVGPARPRALVCGAILGGIVMFALAFAGVGGAALEGLIVLGFLGVVGICLFALMSAFRPIQPNLTSLNNG